MMGTPLERNLITGMMMFDYCPYKHINRDTEDRVVIMMTWRPYENFIEKFEDSTYYQYTMQVYDILKQYVDEDKIIIVPHPKVLEGLKSAVGEDKIWTKPISEVLGLAKLLITDYSSVGYNSFYQGGGVVFYQPDLKRFEEYMQMPLVPQKGRPWAWISPPWTEIAPLSPLTTTASLYFSHRAAWVDFPVPDGAVKRIDALPKRMTAAWMVRVS